MCCGGSLSPVRVTGSVSGAVAVVRLSSDSGGVLPGEVMYSEGSVAEQGSP